MKVANVNTTSSIYKETNDILYEKHLLNSFQKNKKKKKDLWKSVKYKKFEFLQNLFSVLFPSDSNMNMYVMTSLALKVVRYISVKVYTCSRLI